MLFACLCCSFWAFIGESVKLEDNGDINWQCITDLDYEISHLSSNDLERVDELSFLTVLYRHGNRFTATPLSTLFPSYDDPEVTCNVKRVKSTYSYIGDDDKSGFGASDYGLQIEYPFGYQLMPNSNCESTQLSDNTVEQMITQGEILAQRYFSNNNKNNGKNSDQFNKRDRSANNIFGSIINLNRCIDSQVYLFQGLLGENNNNKNGHGRRLLGKNKGKKGKKGKKDNNDGSNDITLITTEIYESRDIDPWRHDRATSYCRTNSAEFQDWYSRYASIVQNSEAKSDYLSTQFALDSISAFESEGGVFSGTSTLGDLGFWYCVNEDIPLTQNTFDNIMEVARITDNTWDESVNASFANKCYYHQLMRVAYNEIYTKLMNALSGNDDKNIFIIGSQGFPTRSFLWGLDMFSTRQAVRQGEMITFEVYLKSGEDGFMYDGATTVDTSDYLFRFTRHGEFLSYPPCETEYINNGNSELCELDTLLNAEFGFSDAISLDDWYNECETAVTDCLCGFCE